MTDLERIELAVRRTADHFGGNGKLILLRLAEEIVRAELDKVEQDNARDY